MANKSEQKQSIWKISSMLVLKEGLENKQKYDLRLAYKESKRCRTNTMFIL